MLKKSNYNIEVDVLKNGEKLIFNTITSIYGIMDSKCEETYNNIENLDESHIQESENKHNIEVMKQAGYIIDKDINELNLMKVKRRIEKFANKQLSLTIAPTMNCNMACPYCYENKSGSGMTDEVIKNLYDFARNYINTNDSKALNVNWYGGEPLLEKETILNLSAKFIELCEEKKINYSASIITNGVLLDKDFAKLLKENCKVKQAQITIDGMPEIHNSRRILIDGSGSFDIIVKNIEDCKEFLSILIRVNVDKENMDKIDKLTKFFLNEKGWGKNPKFYIAPVEANTDCCDIYKSSCLQRNEFAEIDVKYLKTVYDCDPNLARTNFYPRYYNNYCGALRQGNFVVDSNGYLYTCWCTIGIDGKSIGNVNNNLNFTTEYIKWLLYEPKEECLDCKFLPLCQGGCPNTYFENGISNCHDIKYSLKDKLKIAYEDYISNRNTKRILER